MKNIKLVKTDQGFVLRQSIAHLIESLLLAGLWLGFSIFFFVRLPSAEGDAVTLNGLFGFLCAGLGLFFLLTQVGVRLVLNEEGVHLYHLGVRERFMPWWQVRDFGATFDYVHYKYVGTRRHYYLYFSFIKGTTQGPDCLRFRISESDSRTLPKSAIRRYIRARMHREESHEKN